MSAVRPARHPAALPAAADDRSGADDDRTGQAHVDRAGDDAAATHDHHEGGGGGDHGAHDGDDPPDDRRPGDQRDGKRRQRAPAGGDGEVNGQAFTLGPGQQSGALTFARADHGNDTVEVSLVTDPSCGMGDADHYFAKGGSYRMAVVAGRSVCQGGVAGPEVRVTPA